MSAGALAVTRALQHGHVARSSSMPVVIGLIGGEWPERGDGTSETELLKSSKVLFDRLRGVLQALPV